MKLSNRGAEELDIAKRDHSREESFSLSPCGGGLG
jgi:hypothetical protein